MSTFIPEVIPLYYTELLKFLIENFIIILIMVLFQIEVKIM